MLEVLFIIPRFKQAIAFARAHGKSTFLFCAKLVGVWAAAEVAVLLLFGVPYVWFANAVFVLDREQAQGWFGFFVYIPALYTAWLASGDWLKSHERKHAAA